MVVAPAPTPIAPVLVVSLNSKDVNDLDFSHVLPVVREEVDHSCLEGGGAYTNPVVVAMAPKSRALRQK